MSVASDYAQKRMKPRGNPGFVPEGGVCDQVKSASLLYTLTTAALVKTAMGVGPDGMTMMPGAAPAPMSQPIRQPSPVPGAEPRQPAPPQDSVTIKAQGAGALPHLAHLLHGVKSQLPPMPGAPPPVMGS